MTNSKIEKLVKELLKELGEDPNREGLQKTPHRVAKMYAELTKGYKTSRKATINDALFSQNVDNMVILKNIELYSLCEHHLLPFFGKCHVGYIAKDKLSVSVKSQEWLKDLQDVCKYKNDSHRKLQQN